MSRKVILFIFLFPVLSGISLAQSITVNGLRNLDFGQDIFPGIEKSVSRTDATSAKYEIVGEGGREVQITFQLPDHLSDGSGHSLTIYFESAGYSTNETAQSEATSFDPNTGVVTVLGNDGYLYIWVGGRVTPADSQTGNFYQGDITLDVTYTN